MYTLYNARVCRPYTEVGIYQRKQESKKKENTLLTKKAIKKKRKKIRK